MEAGEYGLTRGICFVGRRFEMVAVAGLLWVSWCVFWVRRDFVFFIFFSERTRPLASMRPPCLIYVSASKLLLFPTGLQSYQVPGLRSFPTMEHISVPVRRHPQHSFVAQRSVW